MAYKCNTCGATVPNNATICPYCGNAIAPIASTNNLHQEEDQPSSGLNILSFIVPIAGWIMYFVFKSKTPKKAKSCAKWAWIGFGVSVILQLFSIIYLEDY